MLGSIEAGGTKFVCAISDMDMNTVKSIEIPTTSPSETMGKVKDFFLQYNIKAFGIASFGPVDIDPKSDNYGCITNTPKKLWRGFNILNYLKKVFNVPFEFNTDVNVAALGEAKYGAAQNVNSCIYITVGTGIGVGIFKNGKMQSGLSHPEMGHIAIKRSTKDTFSGNCPSHQDCLEGMASGPAIEERWKEKASLLGDNEVVWDLEAYYLAKALYTYILTLSPEKIILGGGVMKQQQLFPMIRKYLKEIDNGYLSFPEINKENSNYIVSPGIEGKSATIGCFYLAKEKYDALNN